MNVTYSLKIFIISLVMVFLMVLIQYLFKPSLIASPQLKEDIWTTIRPKLEEKGNQFQIKDETSSLISEVHASGEFDKARAYGVVDLNTGQVLAKKNFSQQFPIASLTKIMTAVVASDLVLPDDLFKVSAAAAQIEPTKMGVIPGQAWTRDELLTALLLTSANDAAQVLAEGVGQKYRHLSIFVPAMNEKARFLGLKNSSFDNPQGFDGRYNFSSVEDLMTLTSYTLANYPVIAQIVAKDYQFFPANENHKQADLYNWNGLVGVYPAVKGVKIGNTDQADVTTIVMSERQGKKVLVVLLGAPGVLERDLWAGQLLDVGFEKLGVSAARISEQQLKAKYSTWKYFN